MAFARILRGAGLAVPVSTVVSFAEALGAVGLAHRNDVYWAGRTTLVRRPEDVAVYDRAFAVFWESAEAADADDADADVVSVTLAMDQDEDGDDGEPPAAPSDEPQIELRFSATEVLRHKDFAAYDDGELAAAHHLMARMRFTGSPRRALRLMPSGRGRPDLRRTVRAALRTEGEPLRWLTRAPATRFRRLVLLLDVSGSMESYARELLRFVQAAVAGRRRVEAFALGTRLTRLTRELESRDPDHALALAAERVVDWSGGTRLGDGLRMFNDRWGVRGMARGAVVVILSDGWDRGEPEQLAEQMKRLGRVAHRVVWVNPLKVTPGYAPLARGMAAALPHVDRFVEGHSIDALERLAEILAEP
ncbi:MAG: VWA domain-containing protein [Actinomycetota bacterium]|nr:VWA domain-containing protein [Actinomycetota bacterium]